jgi:hypothetical protein
MLMDGFVLHSSLRLSLSILKNGDWRSQMPVRVEYSTVSDDQFNESCSPLWTISKLPPLLQGYKRDSDQDLKTALFWTLWCSGTFISVTSQSSFLDPPKYK